MKKVVALMKEQSAEESKLFANYLNSRHWKFWHWIEGSWLIVADDSEATIAQHIRDKLNEFSPKAHKYVFEVENVKNWGGFGPNKGDKNMFKWLRENWKD